MVGLRTRPASERRVGSSGPIMGSGVDGLPSPSTLESVLKLLLEHWEGENFFPLGLQSW